MDPFAVFCESFFLNLEIFHFLISTSAFFHLSKCSDYFENRYRALFNLVTHDNSQTKLESYRFTTKLYAL